MGSYIVTIGLGMTIGYTMTQSKRVPEGDYVHTEYIKNINGYKMGWRLTQHKINHDYKFSINLHPIQEEKSKNRFWLF